MKTITINKLNLVNFKGIKNLTIDFNPGTFEIKGDNATGKTTIMDAFLWLLFGKDSTDRKDFELKTLDKNNRVIEKLDHEVTGVLDIDGHTVILKRCFREKWTKRRGAEDAEFTGNETLFYVDDVPYQAGQYSEKISSIVDELVFKMVTNPHYFNSMKWTDRRAVLVNMAGEITDVDIAKTKPEFYDLLTELSGKSFDEFRRGISAKKKALKDDLSLIPARIDEVTRSLPVEPDYAGLSIQLVKAKSELSDTEEKLSNELKRSEAVLKQEQERQKKIFNLISEATQIEFTAKAKVSAGSRERESELNRLNAELAENERSQASKLNTCKSNTLKIEYLENKMNDLREEWNQKSAETLIFDASKFICPACKRTFEADDIEAKKQEMRENFNRSKLEKCESIRREGVELAAQVKTLKEETAKLDAENAALINYASELSAKIKELPAIGTGVINLNEDPQYQQIKKQIADLEGQQYTTAEPSALQSEKVRIQQVIDSLKQQLSVKEAIDKGRARIAELGDETKKKAQLLADLEKQEFIMTDFERVKMNLIEGRVNEMFSLVQFKMFATLINGGIEPCCETLINGVPWADANNAGRINGGLDIINTFCNYYQVSAPIFVDNSEAVNNLRSVKSQLIKLTVTQDKALKFDTKKVRQGAEVC